MLLPIHRSVINNSKSFSAKYVTFSSHFIMSNMKTPFFFHSVGPLLKETFNFFIGMDGGYIFSRYYDNKKRSKCASHLQLER